MSASDLVQKEDRIPGTYSIPLSELICTPQDIHISINLSLSEISSILDPLNNYDSPLYKKLKRVLHGWVTDYREFGIPNAELSKVSAPPTTPDSAFTYSGPEHLPYPEFQVW